MEEDVYESSANVPSYKFCKAAPVVCGQTTPAGQTPRLATVFFLKDIILLSGIQPFLLNSFASSALSKS